MHIFRQGYRDWLDMRTGDLKGLSIPDLLPVPSSAFGLSGILRQSAVTMFSMCYFLMNTVSIQHHHWTLIGLID